MPLWRNLDVQRLLRGALLLVVVVLAWKIEKALPRAEATSGGRLAASPDPVAAAGSRWSWPWLKQVLLDTYAAMSADRLLAVAAGVVFYALLAIFPAITAFVSFYGLLADPATINDHLTLLSDFLPAGGLDIVREQINRIAGRSSELSVGFIGGLLIALWSANAGVKAMIDALNVIEERDERRGFVRLNALSLTFTLGALMFLLVAVGAVVAFPLVMSAFGLSQILDTTTWLIRWPVLLVLVLLAIAMLYRFGPSGGQRRRWVTPGAVFAALAWLAGSAALSFYLSNFADYNATYGSLGAGIGLMMWMWLSTIVVLLGAEFDTVIDRTVQSGPDRLGYVPA
jgi:membrane protein